MHVQAAWLLNDSEIIPKVKRGKKINASGAFQLIVSINGGM